MDSVTRDEFRCALRMCNIAMPVSESDRLFDLFKELSDKGNQFSLDDASHIIIAHKTRMRNG